MNPKIRTLLENLEFHESKDKPELFYRKLEEKDASGKIGVTAFIDFRRGNAKGRRFYTVDGIEGICDNEEDVNLIPVLKYFKDERDKILGIKPKESNKDTNLPEITQPVQTPATQRSPINQDVIKEASKIAKTLSWVVEQTKMFKLINNKKYVYVDGWETLGAMMYCRSEVTDIQEYKDGYKAFVTIFDVDGDVLSKGSAICTRQEKNWKDRDEYAIYSMAQTRALGKAYRLGLSWVMALAGLETTPAEEIEG